MSSLRKDYETHLKQHADYEAVFCGDPTRVYWVVFPDSFESDPVDPRLEEFSDPDRAPWYEAVPRMIGAMQHCGDHMHARMTPLQWKIATKLGRKQFLRLLSLMRDKDILEFEVICSDTPQEEITVQFEDWVFEGWTEKRDRYLIEVIPLLEAMKRKESDRDV